MFIPIWDWMMQRRNCRQGFENARKEMGISDKDDKPLKQNMFKVV